MMVLVRAHGRHHCLQHVDGTHQIDGKNVIPAAATAFDLARRLTGLSTPSDTAESASFPSVDGGTTPAPTCLLGFVPRGLLLASGYPTRLIADVAQEFDDRMCADLRGDTSTEIEFRVDLDEIKADYLGALGDRLQRIAQFGLGHAVRFGRDAAGAGACLQCCVCARDCRSATALVCGHEAKRGRTRRLRPWQCPRRCSSVPVAPSRMTLRPSSRRFLRRSYAMASGPIIDNDALNASLRWPRAAPRPYGRADWRASSAAGRCTPYRRSPDLRHRRAGGTGRRVAAPRG
jgi:hypothetical protein